MKNIFNKPRKYLTEIYNTPVFSEDIINNARNEYSGLSMLCAWVTKKCPLSCENCFFRSNMNCDNMLEEEYNLTDEGITKLIQFVNASNNGYLMLSGGGDPMLCIEKVCRIIKEAHTYRIVIVTSGFWAKNSDRAKEIIDQLYNSYKQNSNRNKLKVILRLSVDEFHEKPLGGIDSFSNIINIFHKFYSKEKGFELYIHTMRNDKTIEKLANTCGGEIKYGERGESDNNKVIKIVPKKATLYLKNEYEVKIGISKIFISDLMVNLNKPYSNQVKEAIKVITDDIENSEQDNPSYIQNTSGKKGLDFWLDYNGNITTWFNQDWYALYNIYIDNYDNIVYGTFKNPLSARFLKKGYENRNNIISEVNPLAVIRAKSINLRDYVAAFLLEEDKTKLYYQIRCLRDYFDEFIINESDLNGLSVELQEAILYIDKKILTELYQEADYDIIYQYFDEIEFNKELWEDLFLLINLGHYEVNEKKLNEKIKFYNKKTNKKILSVSEFNNIKDILAYERLHKRISFMKKEAFELIKKRAE